MRKSVQNGTAGTRNNTKLRKAAQEEAKNV
jgi:hypothetical protein